MERGNGRPPESTVSSLPDSTAPPVERAAAPAAAAAAPTAASSVEEDKDGDRGGRERKGFGCGKERKGREGHTNERRRRGRGRDARIGRSGADQAPNNERKKKKTLGDWKPTFQANKGEVLRWEGGFFGGGKQIGFFHSFLSSFFSGPRPTSHAHNLQLGFTRNRAFKSPQSVLPCIIQTPKEYIKGMFC